MQIEDAVTARDTCMRGMQKAAERGSYAAAQKLQDKIAHLGREIASLERRLKEMQVLTTPPPHPHPHPTPTSPHTYT